jgi:Flp pilus assembly protein TadD
MVCQARTGNLGLFPASGGLNAYIGNNGDWEKTIAARPGDDWSRLATLPQRQGVQGDMWVEHRVYVRAVREYVLEEPIAFLRGLLAKADRFWSAREIPRELDVYTFREWSWCLRALVWKIAGFGFPWGVVLPLALVGLGSRRIESRGWLLVGYVATCSAAVILVFAASRYRVPIVPAVAPFAAIGGIEILSALRAGKASGVLWRSALALLVALAISIPGPFPEERHVYDAEVRRFVGNRFWHEGRLPEAMAQLEAAVERSPVDPVILNEAGEVLVALGRFDEGIEHYRRSLRVRPDSPQTHNLLGVALLAAGKPSEAAAELERAIALDDGYVEAYSNLGIARLREADPRAVAALSRAAALRPDDPAVLQNLGAAQLQTGDFEAALGTLTRAVELDDATADARYLLGVALRSLGRLQEARVQWELNLRRNPAHGLSFEALRETALP